jgi:hypothetical protein
MNTSDSVYVYEWGAVEFIPNPSTGEINNFNRGVITGQPVCAIVFVGPRQPAF